MAMQAPAGGKPAGWHGAQSGGKGFLAAQSFGVGKQKFWLQCAGLESPSDIWCYKEGLDSPPNIAFCPKHANFPLMLEKLGI